jgi:hypothetical protein
VTADEVLFLKAGSAQAIPQALIPDCLHNHGNDVISLGRGHGRRRRRADLRGDVTPPSLPPATTCTPP